MAGQQVPDQNSDKVERLKKVLYSPNSAEVINRRKLPLREKGFAVAGDWEHPKENEEVYMAPTRRRGTFFVVLLSAAIVFFIASLAFAGYMYFRGGNTVSADNVDIAVGAPVQIGGGDALSLDVTVTNNNPVQLVLADVTVTYPDGTKQADDLTKDLQRDDALLGTIDPAAAVKHTFKAVLFGPENSTENIDVTVDYRVPGSNAVFEKEKSFPIFLSSAPVSIQVDAPAQVSSGQEADMTVTVTSNSTSPVSNFILHADYPFGYTFGSASPTPTTDNDTWNLGTLAPQQQKTIVIKGSLTGQDGDQRVVRFSGGSAATNDPKSIGTVVISNSQTFVVEKPFIGATLVFDGNATSNYVAQSGKPVRLDVTYVNNASSTIVNPEIDLYLKGAALDKTTVIADRGFYDSGANEVRWTKENDSDLASLAPGQSGSVSVSFASLGLSQNIASFQNPEIDLSVTLNGTESTQNNAQQSLQSTAAASVKIASDLNLSAQSLYFSGALAGNGPIPPKVGSPTIYTITWTATNGSNDISNAQVTATLPSYVTWVGTTYPSSEDVKFDPVGGQVTWNLGSVPAGTGYSSPKRSASFQVSFTPSISQVGMSPTLVNAATLQGLDGFTSTALTDTENPVTTRIFTDPSFQNGQDLVTQ